jgi:prolyl-tRNA editing enzyme YbaK/EbsC (Cys-tRNA(Pro) deacylase)
MEPFKLGTLASVPAAQRPDLLGESTRVALIRAALLADVGVVEIDPALSDTATTQASFHLRLETLANCVLVGGKREGTERLAACVVLATSRVDVNGVVKRFLDVRKASFLPTERAVELSHMEYGGITPVGLPAQWPLLIDRAVIETDVVVIGSGVRRSKILLPGALLGRMPNCEIITGLGV